MTLVTTVQNNLTRLRKLTLSNTWQTTLSVAFIVFISVLLTIWFFWRSLYLPELKNHARYLATELRLVDEIYQNDSNLSAADRRLLSKTHTIHVDDPSEFPNLEKKLVADFFTQVLQTEIENQLGRSVVVFFDFKPTAQLWIQDSRYKSYWIKEPVIHYSQYNRSLLIAFIFGIPSLSLLTILLLARQLNLPLKNLQTAASNYTKHSQATLLATNKGTSEIRQVNRAFNQLFITLNQAQKERNIMLAGISHDLRTPLTRMRLSAEMLPDEFLKEGLIYDIEDMDAILEQFISFMKDGSDEPLQATDLQAIFHAVIVQFAPIEFIYNDSQLPLMLLRSMSIKRLIVNLVNNANRYGKPPIVMSATVEKNQLANPQNEINTITELELIENTSNSAVKKITKVKKKDNRQDAKEMLIISIYDHGDGVQEDELARIMQPFERGETARTIQGSGLGLSIVSRIAKLHDGHIEIKNHQNGGLMVNVFIPILLDNSVDTLD